MGLLSHKNVYSTKYINAEITDSGSQFHVVHINHVIGDFFMTKIDNQTYVFRIDGRKIKSYHAFGMWTVRKLYYDISHYNPIDGADNEMISQFLEDNKLPKIDSKLAGVIQYLSKRERDEFEVHDMASLFEEIANNKEQYPEQARNMLDFLNHLGRDRIVTPTKRVAELIQEDLLATDAKFLGDTFSLIQQMDNENRLMTNVPVKAKKEWMKMALVLMMIGMVVVVGYMAYTNGWFNNLAPNLNSFNSPKSEDLMAKYPSPESLKAAIDRGEVSYDALPKSIKDMIDKLKAPKVVEVTP